MTCVVLDTPPIPHVADAISLLRRVDGVIVTTLLHNTSGPDAERLRDQLAGLGAPVLGVVANGGSAVDGYAYLPRPGARESARGPPRRRVDRRRSRVRPSPIAGTLRRRRRIACGDARG